MFNRIKRMFVWVRRCRYCRGFGIQSPWTYRFVRYVINEHYPYYAYEDLKRTAPTADVLQLKLCRLYFRIANFTQVSQWIVKVPERAIVEHYINAGCRKTRMSDGNFEDGSVLLMDLTNNSEQVFLQFAEKAKEQSILIVKDIYSTAEAQQIWRKIMTDERTGVTFDLYYCGIVFFDRKLHKQNYIINF